MLRSFIERDGSCTFAKVIRDEPQATKHYRYKDGLQQGFHHMACQFCPAAKQTSHAASQLT